MATTTSQRVGIWVITVVLAVGTIGSFFVMILANDNSKIDQEQAQKQYEEMLKQANASNKPLDGYKAAKFDADKVDELKVETLKKGDGKKLKEDSTIVANYFGWGADGEIFDSTNKDGTVTPATFSLNQVIKGWTQGLTGVKVGSTVRLTIPADLAYGSTDNGDGRPHGPLKFVVEIKELK